MGNLENAVFADSIKCLGRKRGRCEEILCYATTTPIRAGLFWLLPQFSAVMQGCGVFVLVRAQALAEIEHEKRDTSFCMSMLWRQTAEFMNEGWKDETSPEVVQSIKPCQPACPVGRTPYAALLWTQCALLGAANACGLLPDLKSSKKRTYSEKTTLWPQDCSC